MVGYIFNALSLIGLAQIKRTNLARCRSRYARSIFARNKADKNYYLRCRMIHSAQVNPLTKKEIKFSEDYRKVPIVRMGGELFKDSPVIIDELIARLRETKVMSDEEHAVFCSSDAKKWAEWADKQLAVLLFPNLTRSFSESYQVGNEMGLLLCMCFDRFSGFPCVAVWF